MIPRHVVDDYMKAIRGEISGIVGTLSNADDGVKSKIIEILGYNRDGNTVYGMNDRQALHMAALMILNAGVFYEELASYLEEVATLMSLGIVPGSPTKHDIILSMNKILKVNYESVFEIARDLLNTIPERFAADVIDSVTRAVSIVIGMDMQNSGDMYGALYQDDLIERKKSASFYTRPEAATLLASLVLPPAGDGLWDDTSKMKKLRIADFACGTGMLLTAAYNHIIHCHNNDDDIKEMHPTMMGNVLWGFDIMPTATHLTASNLAGLYPSSIFNKSRIYQMPIGTEMSVRGRRRKPVYSLGSLDLIRNADSDMSEGAISLDVTAFAGDGSGKRHGGQGSSTLKSVRLRSNSFDHILMNPPFVRATNHGAGRTDPVPPFAVFGISPDRQISMGKTNNDTYCGKASHGHAGLASYFVAISHAKLKPGGVMGFILPATTTAGYSWNGVRDLLNVWYDDIIIIRLRRSAVTGESTFSSSTGMEEVMLVARKLNEARPNRESPRIKFVLLDRMPVSRLEGLEIANVIRRTTPNRLEHGMGGTSLQLGDVRIGDALDCPVEDGHWMLTASTNIFLLQFVYSLVTGNAGVGMTPLGAISQIGEHALNIDGTKQDGTPQGPFKHIGYDRYSKYQGLWNNKHQTQRTMIVEPDCSLEKKPDATPKHVNKVWSTRSYAHFNLQPRYTSQRLIVAYTRRKTVGGRSWPNVILNNKDHEKAFTVWFNSIFGVLSYWFFTGSQQNERGSTSRSAIKKIPVPDFDSFGDETIKRLDEVFDDMCTKEMLQINMLDTDPVRREIDRRVIEILGVEAEDVEQIYEWLVNEKQLGRKDLVESVSEGEVDEVVEDAQGRRLTQREVDLTISKREDLYNEFKETFSVPTKGGKANIVKMEVTITVAAFANAEGGRLFIGVNDDGEPVGLKKDLKQYKNQDKLENAIGGYLREKLSRNVRFQLTFKNNEYLVIDVPKLKSGDPVYVGDDLYERQGNRNQKLKPREIPDYMRDRGAV